MKHGPAYNNDHTLHALLTVDWTEVAIVPKLFQNVVVGLEDDGLGSSLIIFSPPLGAL